MKISKRQLKRIIKEEKTRLLHESIMDMDIMQDVVGNAPEAIGGVFGESMMELFWEEDARDSGTFREVSEADWEAQVEGARWYLVEAIWEAIQQEVETAESMLHGGDFAK